MKVAVVVFEGFDELDAIGPYEVLRNAALARPELEVAIVTREPAEEVTGSHGMTLKPHGVLDDGYDLVIVPGGGWNDRAPRGARAEAERGDLPAELRRLHERGTAMAAVCTGGMLLASAEITRGRPAVTHHAAIEELRESGAEVVLERVVDDGDLVTAGGVTSGLDLAFWLVEREFGRSLADLIAREMEYERTGGVWPPGARAELSAKAQTGAE
jgi:transcriptional regulator GlxA family with amidase domain